MGTAIRAIGSALLCWMAVGTLVALGIGVHDATPTPGVLLLCLLLVLAPTAVALPAGRKLRAPLWAVETIAAWALLGYLVFLVDPTTIGRGPAYLLGLSAFFGALASPGLLLAAWACPDLAGAIRRQGYLLAGLPCGVLLLRGLDAASPLTTIVFGLLMGAAELLLWSSLRRPSAATPVVAGDSGPAAALLPELGAVAIVGRGRGH